MTCAFNYQFLLHATQPLSHLKVVILTQDTGTALKPSLTTPGDNRLTYQYAYKNTTALNKGFMAQNCSTRKYPKAA